MLQLTIKTKDAAVEAVLKTLESLGIHDWGLERDVLEAAIRWLEACRQGRWYSVATPSDQRDCEFELRFDDQVSLLSRPLRISE